MIELLTYQSSLGDTFEFYSEPVIVPLKDFVWNSDLGSGQGLKKFQSPGRWDAYSFVDVMPISMEGDIFGDDSADYWVNRKALLRAIVPNINNITRNHGRLTMQVTGDGATYYADVILKSAMVPLAAMMASRSEFQFAWECNFGYWRDLGSDNPVVL